MDQLDRGNLLKKLDLCFLYLVLAFGLIAIPGQVLSFQFDGGIPSDIQKQESKPVPTDIWAMQVRPEVSPKALAQERGLTYLCSVGTLHDFHLFQVPAEKTRVFASRTAKELPQVLWLKQQIRRQRFPRLPDDPLFPEQWHLNNTGQIQEELGVDVNVLPVWADALHGEEVQIAVVDDGLQYWHPDIQANYVPCDSWDVLDADPDPSPALPEDAHGTAVAGMATARDDGTSCGVGAAYRSGVAGIRLIAEPVSDAMEAQALTYHYESNHISITAGDRQTTGSVWRARES